jgi:gas vesicle protein
MTKDDAPAAFLGFVLGVTVGAVVALLLAPKAREELRADIAEAVGDGIDNVGDQVKRLSGQAEKLVNANKDQQQTVLDETNSAYKKAKKAGV